MDDLTDYGSLTLCGVMLAAELVYAAAHGKFRDEAASAAVKTAVTSHRAESLREIFPDMANYRSGAENAILALEGKPRNPEVLRYALQLIELATLLRRAPTVVERLGKELDSLPQDPTDAELARVYQASISTLGKRIQVTGNPELLQQESVANEIRALLLAGIRFAWLWHQLGGRRWHLLLQRKALLRNMRALNTVLTSSIH
jgi:high frequency lysogenization protein